MGGLLPAERGRDPLDRQRPFRRQPPGPRRDPGRARDSFFDLKDIRSPIVIFSSAGDNITPPQQALNWIADVYSSTEEIKANGQVIVGLFHESVGHLGVFVSGKVARKEYSQIVEVLKSIEQLSPGLYLMRDPRGRASRRAADVHRVLSRRNGWKTCVGSTSWSGVMSDPSRWYRPFRNSASGPT